MLTKYDPDRAPDPARWLAGDELHLTDVIMRYHRRTGVEVPKPRAHAAMHLIVENQVAMGTRRRSPPRSRGWCATGSAATRPSTPWAGS
jgi:hypothetical protein